MCVRKLEIELWAVKCARNNWRCVLHKFGKQILIVQAFTMVSLDIYFLYGKAVAIQLMVLCGKLYQSCFYN